MKLEPFDLDLVAIFAVAPDGRLMPCRVDPRGFLMANCGDVGPGAIVKIDAKGVLDAAKRVEHQLCKWGYTKVTIMEPEPEPKAKGRRKRPSRPTTQEHPR